MIDPKNPPTSNSSDEELVAWAEYLLPVASLRKSFEDFSTWDEPTTEDLVILEAHNSNDGLGSSMVDALDALNSIEAGIETIELELAFLA